MTTTIKIVTKSLNDFLQGQQNKTKQTKSS